jgi:hypothetical protein
MLMRTERPIERSRWHNILAKLPLMLSIFGVIAVAVALGVAIAFPISNDSAGLFAQFGS